MHGKSINAPSRIHPALSRPPQEARQKTVNAHSQCWDANSHTLSELRLGPLCTVAHSGLRTTLGNRWY